MALKPSEVLDRAADLIEPEGAWTQGLLASGGRGGGVDVHSASAICWCALGAIEASGGGGVQGRCPAARRLARLVGTIALWNDDPARTQPEVVAALRKAAELARSEGE